MLYEEVIADGVERVAVKRLRGETLVLLGSAEAAKFLGISKGNLSARVVRGQIVPPRWRLACGPLWTLEDLEQWAYEKGRSLEPSEAPPPSGDDGECTFVL